jgi:pimeloyl-ACP methyl ester carboxylesterase
MTALLDACGIARVVAGGLSLGGFLSLEFCLAHPDQPPLVNRHQCR